MQSRKDPIFIEERIEAFLNSFLEQLKVMPADDFSTRRRGLIVKKLEKAKNLAEETGDYWDQIRSGYYNFSQGELHRCELQREQSSDLVAGEADAAALETVTKEEMIDVYERYLLRGGPCRRTLAVHLVSQKLEVVLPLPRETIKIVDIQSFKAGLDWTRGATPVTAHTSHIPDSRI